MRVLLPLLLVCFSCVCLGVHGEEPAAAAATSATTSTSSRVDEVSGFPSPAEFLRQYVEARRPLLIRQAHASPATLLWTDDHLRKKFASLQVVLQHNATHHLQSWPDSLAPLVTVGEFLSASSSSAQPLNEHSAVFSQIPQAMAAEFVLPKTLNCPPFDQALIESMLWMTSTTKGDGDSFTYSSLRDYSSFLSCQVRESRRWSLIESGAFRHVDEERDIPSVPENVFDADHKQWPLLDQLPIYVFDTMPGDCVFVPGGYFFQANRSTSSADRSVAVNILLSGPTTTFTDVSLGSVNDEVCATRPETPLSEANVAWTYDGSGANALTMGYDDPSLIRNLWSDIVKRGKDGVLNEEQFRQALEVEIKDLLEHLSADEQSLKEKVVSDAIEKFFKPLAGEKGAINVQDVEKAPRATIIEGLRTYFTLLHKFYSHAISMDGLGLEDLEHQLEEFDDEDDEEDEEDEEDESGEESQGNDKEDSFGTDETITTADLEGVSDEAAVHESAHEENEQEADQQDL